MANGGIYDQVGGGFARYSVDARWLVPHFEKMLYDNALLARAYLHGWQVTGDPLLRRVCEETLDWMLRELRQAEGGFASALDADSEGVEGKFYVWTLDEVRDAARRRRRGARSRYFGMTAERQLRGREHPRARAADPRGASTALKARLYAARERARLAGARRQAADLLERAGDLGAGRRRRGARPRGLPRRRARRAPSFLLERDARRARARLLRTYNRGAGAARRPTSRTTRSCSRRC